MCGGGVCFNSEGTGDLSIKARNVERSLLSEIYISDYKYYADDNKVNTDWQITTGNSNKQYNSIYTASVDENIEFKFSNIPTNIIFGINNAVRVQQRMDNNTRKIWCLNPVNFTKTLTSETVIKLSINSNDSVSVYFDDVLEQTVTIDTSQAKTLYLEEFNSDPYSVEYIKVL